MEATILDVKDNEFLRQFETNIEGRKATIEYAMQPRNVFLTKLMMDESLINEGYEDVFIKAVFEIIEKRNTRMVPTCPIIAKYFKKNRRKYKALLPVGMNL